MSTDLARARVAFLQACLVAAHEALTLPPEQAINPAHTLAPEWYLGYGNSPSLSLKNNGSFVTAPSFSATPFSLCPLPHSNTAALGINGPYAKFFIHNPSDEKGYGGSTFTVLITSGDTRSFRGPWSSRVSAISTHFPTSPALCECSLNCCSALTLRSIIHRMAHLDRSVPANISTPSTRDPSNEQGSLRNPAGRWALLAHSALYSESEFECYITPIILLPGDSGFWMKGDDSKHDLAHNSIARSSQIYIIDPPQRLPLWTPPVPSRPVDSIIPGRVAAIQSQTCMPKPLGCGGPATSFTDTRSRAEYAISGFCQSCQDAIFGAPSAEGSTPVEGSTIPEPDETTDWDEAELADLPNSGVDPETLEDVEDTVARTIRNTPTSELELKPNPSDPSPDPDLFDDRDRNDRIPF